MIKGLFQTQRQLQKHGVLQGFVYDPELTGALPPQGWG